MSGSNELKRDLFEEAGFFSAHLVEVLKEKRDPRAHHLLETARYIVDGLLAENRGKSNSGTPRHSRSGGVGQLWVELQKLKLENENLRKHVGRGQYEERGIPAKSTSQESNDTGLLKADLQRVKNENECLKQQNEKMHMTEKDLQTLNDECKRLKKELKESEKAAEKAKRDLENLETSLSSVKTENESLKQKLTSLVKPRQRTGNQETENINERCRPSVIAVKYNTLESQEWVDAKENLEESTGQDEEEILRFLCAALMATYETSLDIYQNLELAIAELLRNPTLAMDITRHIARDLPKLPEEITDAIRFRLRQTVEHINTEGFTEIVKRSLSAEFSDGAKHISRHKSVNQFLKESIRLTWQMVIQKPPMTLSTQDNTFDGEKHRLWWSCDQSHGKTIDYFIWPVLKDYEDGAVLVKGCVYAHAAEAGPEAAQQPVEEAGMTEEVVQKDKATLLTAEHTKGTCSRSWT